MPAKRSWPLIRNKLLWANIIVYGATVLLVLTWRHELTWAQKALRGYLYTGSFDPPADVLLTGQVNKYLESPNAEGLKQAESILKQALEIDPYGRAHYLLGNCYLMQGRDDEAMASYDRYRSIDPSSWQVYLNMIRTLQKRGDVKGAKKLVEEGIAHFRRRVQLYVPHEDPDVQQQFNEKAVNIYQVSQELLKLLEREQEQLNKLQ